jgi:hypothetical protein
MTGHLNETPSAGNPTLTSEDKNVIRRAVGQDVEVRGKSG